MRVLVVDDDYDLRMLCASILRWAGIKVLAAATAEAGLDILDRKPCDLAILDIRLPGMSGLEALKAVAVKWPAPGKECGSKTNRNIGERVSAVRQERGMTS